MTTCRSLALTICHHQHAAEWKAPYPRTQACGQCFRLAGALVDAGWSKS